jgi:hypothetical protein
MIKRNIRLTILIWAFLGFNLCHASDTLRVYVTGYFFNGETYRVYYNGHLMEWESNVGSDFSAFDIELPDSIEDGQRLNMEIYRKGRFGMFWRDTRTDVVYNSKRSYCILMVSFRLKKRYSLNNEWSDYHYQTFALKEDWVSNPITKSARWVMLR